ncbi:hypothetical protein O6H91_Y070100 [Diphasiastrum complanatum]|nr:hypothetical protein O6H91_Y070100 [Diphasiastrum complanatum]
MIFRRLAAFLVEALSHLAVRQSVGAQGQTNANNMVLSSILYSNQTLSSSGGMFRRLAAFLVVALLHLAVRQSVGAQGETNANNMVLSSILYANQTLSSSGGIFELGFYSLPGSTSPSSYMLAIWYAHVYPNRTLVWMADRNFKMSQAAYLQLSSDGRLLLFDPSSGNSQPLWASTNETRINVTGAYLLSTGNLVILDNMNSTVWQSFDTPTDTLLPGQRYFPNSSRKLQSWNTPTDWGEGRFFQAWDSNQHFYLFWNLTNGPKAYWPIDWSSYPQGSRETWGVLDFTSDIAYVDDTGLGDLYLANSTTNETRILLKSSGVPGRLRRVTLDREGDLRLYSWTLGTSTNWSMEADNLGGPIMKCTVEGICGPYGLCTSAQTDLQCAFPVEGFEYIDPADTFQGCKRTVQLLPSQCNSSNSLRLTTLTSIDYPDSDYSVLNHSFSSCSQKCLEDCWCEGMTYSYTNHSCWLKKGALWNGNYIFSGGLINSYLKISALSQPSSSAPAPTPAPLPRKHSVNKLKLALVIGLTGSIGVLCISSFCFMMLRRRKIRNLEIETKLESLLSSPVLMFTYKELKVATNNFREEIGRGGSGSVFKGEVGRAKHAVAVKRLQKLGPEGEKGFIAEVMTIGSIHHLNLVTLSGYCAEGPHRLLVYEYVEQGSLDKFLFDPETPILEWRIRFQMLWRLQEL